MSAFIKTWVSDTYVALKYQISLNHTASEGEL